MASSPAAPSTSAARIDPGSDPEWDSFVLRQGTPRAHAYHLGVWSEIFRRAYGAAPCYLVARDAAGELAAGLPLVVEGGLSRGGRASSLMMDVRGGPIGVDAAARAIVLDAACRLVDERRLKGLLMTTEVPGCERLVAGLRVLPVAYSPTWITPLPADPDELRRVWRKRSRNLSRSLGKAEQAGVVVRAARSRTDLWRFYRQYVHTMRAHRHVPRSWLEIRLIHKLLAPTGGCRVWLAEYQGEVVAGALFVATGNTLDPLYIGADPRTLDVRPNHALYWHGIKWAIASGLTAVDWGSAPADSSLGRFKQQWSAEPVDLFHYVYVPGAATERSSESHPRAMAEPPSEHVAPPGGSGHTMPRTGLAATAWDRFPVNALGVAATLAHRLL